MMSCGHPPLNKPTQQNMSTGVCSPFAEAFTTLRSRKRHVLGRELHLQRLVEHAVALGIEPSLPALYKLKLHEVINARDDLLIRISIDRSASIQVTTRKAPEPHRRIKACTSAFASPAVVLNLSGLQRTCAQTDKNLYRTPFGDLREEEMYRFIGLKHGAWQFYSGATRRCKNSDYDSAIFVNAKGVIVDGDRATPLVVTRNKEIIAPRQDDGSVQSVTLALLEKSLLACNFTIQRKRIHHQQLFHAAEVLMLGAGVGVAKVVQINATKLAENSYSIQPYLCEVFDSLFDEVGQDASISHSVSGSR